MKPAYHIALTASEKRMMAELAAIHSQIEWLMRLTVQHLLTISPALARTIMGSTVIRANAAIWIATVRQKHPDTRCKEIAETAYEGITQLAQNRNDFIHAIFGFATEEENVERMGPLHFWPGHHTNSQKYMRSLPRRAVRVRTSTEIPLPTIAEVHKEAARLSVMFAQVEWGVNPTATGRSPWLRKLAALPPSRPQKGQPKKGKGRGNRPPPSRG